MTALHDLFERIKVIFGFCIVPEDLDKVFLGLKNVNKDGKILKIETLLKVISLVQPKFYNVSLYDNKWESNVWGKSALEMFLSEIPENSKFIVKRLWFCSTYKKV